MLGEKEKHTELIKKHLGTVVSIGDNYISALNTAVFADVHFAISQTCFLEI